jgi:hypothetical protein
MNDVKSIENTEQHLAEPSPIVRAVHLSKPEQGMLKGPLAGHTLCNPMPCNGKVCVGVAHLPCIASHADLTDDSRALRFECQCEGEQEEVGNTYIQMVPE